ncbi:uncharacterized protein A1O9_07848 [Exophiala aquamarina CBS 119918]|uniref:F-box domain-containing protein n=1 Tax=Exophiala aquamarina CBS 119918 TaxID=1182545 RepID=A0A072P983_9EURO|nr:uncharacterized protein A1O9_07848 [Exophiala aquamarina CBS 119918]KEF56267.1 hypothetical protein A1O9_07848 [Exophiala aquamarina CBS 119918]
MEDLPEEILVDILDCLEVEDLISVQETCSFLSKSARANTLWRYKCFEKSPSASMMREKDILSSLAGALKSLSLSDEPMEPPSSIPNGESIRPEPQTHASRRAQAANKWDLSAAGEAVDWYSEFKARHAPLTTEWLTAGRSDHEEIRGISTIDHSSKLVGYLEDHSLRIWDLREEVNGKRYFRELGRSKPALLSTPCTNTVESFVIDSVGSVTAQQKSFIAVGNVLNEVDLNTLQVVSRSKYAWPITALSQTSDIELPLTVGTQWSLHILDPRAPVKPLEHKLDDRVEEIPATPGASTALLPNLTDDSALLPSQFGITSPFAASPGPSIWAPGSPSWKPSHRLQNPHWMAYARVEPGPLAILHHAENEILTGGRFPSILSFDRRYFPRLQYVIHSSASLSGLASIPHRAAGSSPSLSNTSTLVACGEYRGRGSLELYSLPHLKQNSDGGDAEALFSYKNRQDAARSKLLSVSTHGTKIVYSDSEGGLKWVERDGRSLVRKWNINNFDLARPVSNMASISGDQVARKIVPLTTHDSEYGMRGDGDLLIWTGERVGIVTTKTQRVDHQQMVSEIEDDEFLGEEQKQKEREEEYSKAMRRALERQADERIWMSRFRLKSGRW